MVFPTLKLVIEKGPREGETFEFNSKPRSTVRIGRVVRGNTFAIKDNGISSKHLSIEWCGSQENWVVKDLNSVNGTFLNSSALPPLTGHDLRDGDVLKIGEVTSIRVQISHLSDSQPVGGRNLRSRARVLGTGNSDGAQNVAEEGNRRGRGRGVTENGGPVSKRRTKNSKNEDKGETLGDISQKTGDVSLRRRTRSRGIKNNDCSALERIPEASQLQEKPTRRGRKKNEAENVKLNGGGQTSRESMHSIVEEEDERGANGVISEQETCHELEIAVIKPEAQSNVEGIVSKGERPSKESMCEIVEKDGDLACQLDFEHETREELEATSNQDDMRDPECNIGGVDIQESTAADKDDEAEIAPDLTKMTVGEWLDYLERIFPKQIRAKADQTIKDMRKRSQQYHEFMLQQQKDK